MSEFRSAKKKQLYQLAVARSDIKDAMTTCELLIQHVEGLGDKLYQPLFHAIVMAYARPFTRNQPLGPLPAEWSKFSNPHFQETHDDLIKSRHQFIAHSDEEIRKVIIFPPGASLGKTGLKSGGVSISIRTIAFRISKFHDIRDLCHDLGSRLDKRVNAVVTELYTNRKLPNKSFQLTFDDGL
jgi:hypothetical protein